MTYTAPAVANIVTPKPSAILPSNSSVTPPPPPPPRPPPFDGQEGEMSLKKDDLVELVEKDDNGWWLVKKDGQQGWAPNNYLELVPQRPKSTPVPPPPNRRPPPVTPGVASMQPLMANSSAQPVAVFPAMASSGGSVKPSWKKSQPAFDASDETSVDSGLPSAVVNKPPPVVNKPKPPAPPTAAKPATAPKPSGAPPVPVTPRPAPSSSTSRGGTNKPTVAVGQLDLAAAVSVNSSISVKLRH
jgi:myosin-1